MIPNCSKSYEAYEQVAHPDMGATVPAGKDDKNELDTLKAKHTKATVTDAHETKGACLKAMHKQAGDHMDNMNQTKAGNAPDDELEY
jgi:hypothetical protein